MDWSPIIAGGITGLLSGAVSGNLIQYVLDRRRTRDKNRHQLLYEWDNILNDDEYTYKGIVSHPKYETLKSLISSETRRDLFDLEIKTNKETEQIMLDWDIGIETTEDTEQRFLTVERGAKQELIACLKREVLRLQKKWRMI